GALHAGRLRWAHRVLHRERACPRGVEIGHVRDGEPREHRGADPGGNRAHLRRLPAARTPHAPGRARRFRLPDEPLGLGVGGGVDRGGGWAPGRPRCPPPAAPPDAASPWTGPPPGVPPPCPSGRETDLRVSVVIPTYNEAQSIGRVLDDIPRTHVTEVLVVD